MKSSWPQNLDFNASPRWQGGATVNLGEASFVKTKSAAGDERLIKMQGVS